MGDCVMKEFPNANCQTEYCLTSTNGGLGRFVIAQILPTFLNHILFVRYVHIHHSRYMYSIYLLCFSHG